MKKNRNVADFYSQEFKGIFFFVNNFLQILDQ